MNSKLNGIYSKDVRTSFCFSFRALEYYIGGYICAHFAKGKEGFSSNLFMFNWFKSGSLSQGQHFPLKQHFASVVNMMISIFWRAFYAPCAGAFGAGVGYDPDGAGAIPFSIFVSSQPLYVWEVYLTATCTGCRYIDIRFGIDRDGSVEFRAVPVL